MNMKSFEQMKKELSEEYGEDKDFQKSLKKLEKLVKDGNAPDSQEIYDQESRLWDQYGDSLSIEKRLEILGGSNDFDLITGENLILDFHDNFPELEIKCIDWLLKNDKEFFGAVSEKLDVSKNISASDVVERIENYREIISDNDCYYNYFDHDDNKEAYQAFFKWRCDNDDDFVSNADEIIHGKITEDDSLNDMIYRQAITDVAKEYGLHSEIISWIRQNLP